MTGSSSSDQVHLGGGVPLTLQTRKTGSLGLTTFSLKEDRIFGVPSVVGEEVEQGWGVQECFTKETIYSEVRRTA